MTKLLPLSNLPSRAAVVPGVLHEADRFPEGRRIWFGLILIGFCQDLTLAVVAAETVAGVARELDVPLLYGGF